MMRRFTILLLLALFAGTALARVVKFVPVQDRGEGYAPCVIEKEGVTVTLSRGSAYLSYYQLNSGSTCTVHSEDGNIVQIVMHGSSTVSEQYSPSGMTANVGDYGVSGYGGLWNGEDKTVVFTAPDHQIRIESIEVVVYGGGPLQPPHILPASDKVFYDTVEMSYWFDSDNAII